MAPDLTVVPFESITPRTVEALPAVEVVLRVQEAAQRLVAVEVEVAQDSTLAEDILAVVAVLCNRVSNSSTHKVVTLEVSKVVRILVRRATNRNVPGTRSLLGL